MCVLQGSTPTNESFPVINAYTCIKTPKLNENPEITNARNNLWLRVRDIIGIQKNCVVNTLM